jgi:hypothetical protein
MSEQDNKKDLEMMVIEIKLGTERLISKLDQLNSGVSRLETSLCKMDKTVEELEKKVLVLEQTTPPELHKELALIKNSQETHAKFMWLLGGGIISVMVKIFTDLISK